MNVLKNQPEKILGFTAQPLKFWWAGLRHASAYACNDELSVLMIRKAIKRDFVVRVGCYISLFFPFRFVICKIATVVLLVLIYMEAVKVPDTLRHQESVYADHVRQTEEITPHYVICQYRVSYDVSSSFRVLCCPNIECLL